MFCYSWIIGRGRQVVTTEASPGNSSGQLGNHFLPHELPQSHTALGNELDEHWLRKSPAVISDVSKGICPLYTVTSFWGSQIDDCLVKRLQEWIPSHLALTSDAPTVSQSIVPLSLLSVRISLSHGKLILPTQMTECRECSPFSMPCS